MATKHDLFVQRTLIAIMDSGINYSDRAIEQGIVPHSPEADGLKAKLDDALTEQISRDMLATFTPEELADAYTTSLISVTKEEIRKQALANMKAVGPLFTLRDLVTRVRDRAQARLDEMMAEESTTAVTTE